MSVINRIYPGEAAPVSNAILWAGRIMTALPVLFLLMDGIMKRMKPEAVVKATVISVAQSPPTCGVLIWGGLFLRDPRLREFIPIRVGSGKR
jgi:hypothetical protein